MRSIARFRLCMCRAMQWDTREIVWYKRAHFEVEKIPPPPPPKKKRQKKKRTLDKSGREICSWQNIYHKNFMKASELPVLFFFSHKRVQRKKANFEGIKSQQYHTDFAINSVKNNNKQTKQKAQFHSKKKKKKKKEGKKTKDYLVSFHTYATKQKTAHVAGNNHGGGGGGHGLRTNFQFLNFWATDLLDFSSFFFMASLGQK